MQESEFSFPSGHSTASMAAMMAFFLAGNKKYSWTGFIAALLIGFSRIYLCVHYPSDVLFGFIVGIIAGTIAYLIVWLLYKYLKDTKVGNVLYDKDVITLYNYIKNKYFNKKTTVIAEGNDNSCNVSDNNSLSCDKDCNEESLNKKDIKDNSEVNDIAQNKGNIESVTDVSNINDKN